MRNTVPARLLAPQILERISRAIKHSRKKGKLFFSGLGITDALNKGNGGIFCTRVFLQIVRSVNFFVKVMYVIYYWYVCTL